MEKFLSCVESAVLILKFCAICLIGDVGWGIAWYVNGMLIPEITLERGKTYTFIIEGGNDPENSARSHPFYITDDPEGGYLYKTAAERKVTTSSVIFLCNVCYSLVLVYIFSFLA